MGRAIFISYRRDDTEGEAGRLFDDLIRAFGDNSVFMDVAGINPGMDFRKAIDDNVSSCGVLLAMIGPTWTTIANHDGTRRLDDPNDFVRLEIASALARSIAVIPVLVHDAKMPHPDDLPDNLKDLAFRNSVEITHARWNSDVQLLIGALGQYVSASAKKSDEPVHATIPVQLPPANPQLQAPAKPRSKMKLYLGLGAAALVLVILIAVLASSGSKSDTPETNADTTPASETTDTAAPSAQTPAAAPASGQTADPDANTSTASTAAEENPLVGMWQNPSPLSDNGIKTIEIREVDGHLTMHAWGACTPNDCDWGERVPASDGTRLQAVWGSAEQGRIARITVGPSGENLGVLIQNTYTNYAPITRQFVFDRVR
jgi:hypothetical protein